MPQPKSKDFSHRSVASATKVTGRPLDTRGHQAEEVGDVKKMKTSAIRYHGRCSAPDKFKDQLRAAPWLAYSSQDPIQSVSGAVNVSWSTVPCL